MMAINKQINIDDSLTLLDEQQMPSQYNPDQINLTRQNHNKRITILTLPTSGTLQSQPQQNIH